MPPLTGNETQTCKNCGALVKFSIDDGCWLHVNLASAQTIVWRERQCHLFARPTTLIEGVDY